MRVWFRPLLPVAAVLAVALTALGALMLRPDQGACYLETAAQRVIHLSTSTLPRTDDPLKVLSVPDQWLVENLYEALVEGDPRTFEPQAAAAESWEISPDLTVFTFRLRPEAAWSDGTPVVAGDFLRTVRRRFLGLKCGPVPGPFRQLVGIDDLLAKRVSDFAAVGLAAPDEHTLVLRFVQPQPEFMQELLATPWIPTAPGDEGDDGLVPDGRFLQRRRNNGPFSITSSTPREVRVHRNPRFREAPTVWLEGAVWHGVSDPRRDELLFNAGLVHVSDLRSPLEAARAGNRPELVRFPANSYHFLHFNTRRGPFADAGLRRALVAALDRVQLAQALALPPEAAAEHFDVRAEPGPRDASALALAASNARAALPFGLRLTFPATDESRALSDALAEQWKRELGVIVRRDPRGLRELLDAAAGHDFDVLLLRLNGAVPTTHGWCSLWASRSSLNLTGWSDPEFDAAVRNFSGRPGEDEALEAHLFAAAPAVPLVRDRGAVLVRRNVENWPANPGLFRPLRGVRLRDTLP